MQRYFSKEKIGNSFVLDSNDIYHIKTVMRMKDNDFVEIVYDKKVYLCCIENVNSNITFNIEKEIENDMKNDKEIILAVPLLKEQKMDLILQKSTELGVNKIIPIYLERSIIKLKHGDESKKLERWRKIVKEASEQSHRVDIPVITDIKKISELEKIDALKVVCSTVEKEKNIKNLLISNKCCDRILVVMGPEGGLAEKEEEYLKNIGFNAVTLGSRILRVETVPLFILSVINYEFME